MKKIDARLCAKALLFSVLFATAADIQAQTAYAVTGESKGNFNWTAIRIIDIQTGKEKSLVLGGQTPKFKGFRTGNKSVLKPEELAQFSGGYGNGAMAAGVAACAFDRAHNRLYYTPLHLGQLRYVDLGSADPKIVFVTSGQLNPESNLQLEDNMITRMAIGADGNGYAINNNGNHLIRFSTDKEHKITDLGPLVDAGTSPSVHDKATSWGGDIIADAYNNLYLISAYNYVFRIDVTTRKVESLGKIKGLPEGFTTNGALVKPDDRVLLSSAYNFDGYFDFDLRTLEASPVAKGPQVFNASDLASAHLAFESELSKKLDNKLSVREDSRSAVGIYPNPAVGGQFRLSFGQLDPGTYTVQVFDLQGRALQSRQVNIGGKYQVETIGLKKDIVKGAYLVKVTSGSKLVFSDKLLVK